MKTLFLFTSILLTAIAGYAQKGSTQATYVSPTAKIEKFYTMDELKQLGKIELTNIYMERVVVVTEIIPYIALHTKPGATLKEMGIPETPANIEHVEKEVKNKGVYLSAVKNTLDDIIPYADKGNIIWAIMFMEDIIKKADGGEGGTK